MTIPLILYCGAPRTGTNYLAKILSGFPSLKVHTEVFARDIAYTVSNAELDRLVEITGCQIPTRIVGKRQPQSLPTTTQLISDEPYATIQALWECRAPEHKAMAIKLFGYHLPRSVTKELFSLGAIPLVVKRCKIDSYASKLKAQKLQQWVNADTTLVRVEGDVRDYLYWEQRHSSWYDHIDACRPSPPTLYYEADIAGRPKEELASKIRDMMAVYGVHLGEWHDVPAYSRQDRNSGIEGKLANWPAFASELDGAGLLDGAMGYF